MNRFFVLACVAFLATGCSSASSGESLSNASPEPLPSSTSSASAASVPSESSDPYDINASMSFDTYEPEDPELNYDYSRYETIGDRSNGHAMFWIWEIEPDVWRCAAMQTRNASSVYKDILELWDLPCTLTRMRSIVEDHFDRESHSHLIYWIPYPLTKEEFDEGKYGSYWTVVTDAYFYYRLGLLATWYYIQQWGDGWGVDPGIASRAQSSAR